MVLEEYKWQTLKGFSSYYVKAWYTSQYLLDLDSLLESIIPESLLSSYSSPAENRKLHKKTRTSVCYWHVYISYVNVVATINKTQTFLTMNIKKILHFILLDYKQRERKRQPIFLKVLTHRIRVNNIYIYITTRID